MTDYRRTDEELWDEDAIAEEDRKPDVVARFDLLDGEPDLEDGPALPAQDTVISDMAHLFDEPSRKSSAGRRELVEARFGRASVAGARLEHSSAPPPVPEQLPAELPSIVPPPPSSAAEGRERVTVMPKTHPLANSLVPGGSGVSLPPMVPRRSLRWQAAVGGGALLIVGLGASLSLQSRGEHHAAGRATLAAPEVGTEPALSAPEAARSAVAISQEAPAPAIMLPAPALAPDASTAPRPRSEGGAMPARAARPTPSMRIAFGSAQMEGEAESQRAEQAARAARPDETPPQESGDGREGLAEPRFPARDAIIESMAKLTPQLRECVGEEHGVVDVTLTVRGSGVVSHALVHGTFAGSDKGSCLARTLRSARVPPFTEPVLRVEYPIQL